jgi:hypothetical protein
MQSVTRATSHSFVEDLAVQAKVCGQTGPHWKLCADRTHLALQALKVSNRACGKHFLLKDMNLERESVKSFLLL